MKIDKSRVPGVIRLFCVLFVLWLSCPVHGDPLDNFTKPLPGMGEIWNPPGWNKSYTLDKSDSFTISWSHSNIVRYKLDDELKYLQASKGPIFGIQHSTNKSWYSLSWLMNDTELQFMNNGNLNRLDGDRTNVDFEMGYIFPIEDDSSITLATRFDNDSLFSKGRLPVLFRSVPGLGDNEESSFTWEENNWTLASYFNHDNDSIGLVLGGLSRQISLTSESDDEHVKLEFAPFGCTLGLIASTRIDDNVDAQVFYRFGLTDGEKGVFRQGEKLGLLDSGVNSWLFGLNIYSTDEIPDWNLSFTTEKSSTRLKGSADISGFVEPVFGIISPRAHADAHYSHSLTSLGYNKNVGRILDSDFTGLCGLTYWDVDCNLKTWESLLFGSAQINEQTSYLETESGLLFHLGFKAKWDLSNRDELCLNFGQSIPIYVNEGEKESSQPGLSHDRSYDGGRTISINYSHRF